MSGVLTGPALSWFQSGSQRAAWVDPWSRNLWKSSVSCLSAFSMNKIRLTHIEPHPVNLDP